MAAALAPCLFTETALNVAPASPGSIVPISTESSKLWSSRKRAHSEVDVATDEEQFARKHLATEASIFFRSREASPRNILWRVVEDGRVLEIQSVDLTQDRGAKGESVLTFRLEFAHSMRPDGVAFADSRSHDALEVFVLTSNNELFTFSLRRDLLLRSTRPDLSEFDPSSTFRSYTLSSFSFRHPFKLVALRDTQLVVTLHDGGLLRLDRKPGESGGTWRETFFNEGGWGSSLRGLIPWKGQGTSRHNGLDLASTAVAAVEVAPSGEHIITASLDHTLKAWNTETGRVGFQVDLLGDIRTDTRTQQPYVINPSQRSLLKVVEVEDQPDGDIFYCVVYSPKDHQFKFWAVRDADSAEYGIRDVHPDLKLIPPIDEFWGTNGWQLADFQIAPGSGWNGTTLWIRARSGSVCKVFSLTFDLFGSPDDLEYAWKHQWSSVSEGSLSLEHLSSTSELTRLMAATSASEALTVAEQWQQFLLFPGRFSPQTIETALHIYRKGRGFTSSPRLDRTASLQDRLSQTVAAKIGTTRTLDGRIDFDKIESDTAAQWRIFFGLVRHLHQRRADSLGLALDPETGLCWSIRAEHVGVIRACADAEVFSLNKDILADQDDDWILNSFPLAEYIKDDPTLAAARLLDVARGFRLSFSLPRNASFERLASTFALRDAELASKSKQARTKSSPLQQLYEQCDLADAISDSDFDRLTDSVQDLGGLGGIENTVFLDLLDKFRPQIRGQDREQNLCRYGAQATIRGAQDVVLEERQIILDLLALVVFMSQDLEADELARGFKPLELYLSLVARLREVDVLLWLVSHIRAEPTVTRRSGSVSDIAPSHTRSVETQSPSTSTILESVFIGDWTEMPFPDETLPRLLTYWIHAWTFGANIAVEHAGVTAHIVASLIKYGDFQLASDFAKFLPNNSWVTYLKARQHLGQGEYTDAAALFRRAAQDLAHKTPKKSGIDALDTAGLLAATDKQSFNSGQPAYYLHVAQLFETNKMLSYTADFAWLALTGLEEANTESLDSSMMEIDSRKKNSYDSPVAVRANLVIEEIQLLKRMQLKEEILSRLFNAALQVTRFQIAFDALVKFNDPAMKRASLTQLLTSILAISPALLLSLPFPAELSSEVDNVLLRLSRKHISSASEPGALYHQILFSWRMSREDYRGAAAGLYERLSWLRDTESYHGDDDVEDELSEVYLLVINTLACCGPGEEWILATPVQWPDAINSGDNQAFDGMKGRRKLVTLQQVRAEFQRELDQRSETAHGRFALTGPGTTQGGTNMELDVF